MTERNRTEKPEAPSNAIGKILSFIRERRYQPSERCHLNETSRRSSTQVGAPSVRRWLHSKPCAS